MSTSDAGESELRVVVGGETATPQYGTARATRCTAARYVHTAPNYSLTAILIFALCALLFLSARFMSPSTFCDSVLACWRLLSRGSSAVLRALAELRVQICMFNVATRVRTNFTTLTAQRRRLTVQGLVRANSALSCSSDMTFYTRFSARNCPHVTVFCRWMRE